MQGSNQGDLVKNVQDTRTSMSVVSISGRLIYIWTHSLNEERKDVKGKKNVAV